MYRRTEEKIWPDKLLYLCCIIYYNSNTWYSKQSVFCRELRLVDSQQTSVKKQNNTDVLLVSYMN